MEVLLHRAGGAFRALNSWCNKSPDLPGCLCQFGAIWANLPDAVFADRAVSRFLWTAVLGCADVMWIIRKVLSQTQSSGLSGEQFAITAFHNYLSFNHWMFFLLRRVSGERSNSKMLQIFLFNESETSKETELGFSLLFSFLKCRTRRCSCIQKAKPLQVTWLPSTLHRLRRSPGLAYLRGTHQGPLSSEQLLGSAWCALPPKCSVLCDPPAGGPAPPRLLWCLLLLLVSPDLALVLCSGEDAGTQDWGRQTAAACACGTVIGAGRDALGTDRQWHFSLPPQMETERSSVAGSKMERREYTKDTEIKPSCNVRAQIPLYASLLPAGGGETSCATGGKTEGGCRAAHN